jgi:ATP-dependent Clp protease protease subunit
MLKLRGSVLSFKNEKEMSTLSTRLSTRLSTLVCLFVVCLTVGGSGTNIVLKRDNFASLRDAIDSESAARLVYQLNEINGRTTPVYLYINSPGGDVMAGLEIITYIKSLQAQNRSVHCIAHEAMSMAFVLFQYCSERYIMAASTLMQHQMAMSGIKGKIYDINSRLAYYNTVEQELNAYQAERLNMTTDAFVKKIQHDWWLFSNEILTWHGADKMVTLSCDFPNSEVNTTVSTLFGDVHLVYSACPIINQPLRISFSSVFPEVEKRAWLNSRRATRTAGILFS